MGNSHPIEKKDYTEKEKLEINRQCEEAFSAHSKSSLQLAYWTKMVNQSGSFLLTHATLFAYMKDHFEIEKSRVFQLLKAAETMDEFKEIMQISAEKVHSTIVESDKKLPNLTGVIKNEGHARALAEVPKEKRVEVLESLVESGIPVTAKSIEVAAATLAGNEKHKPKSEPKKTERLLEHVQEAFNLSHHFDAIISDLIMAVDKAKQLKAKKVGEFIQIERFSSIVENAKAQIAFAKPWADCVPCQQKGCKLCHQRGWLPRELFKTIPEDLRSMSVIKGKK